VDGVLESKLIVGVEACFGGRLWIPSPIELMTRERISDCGRLECAIFEQGSKLVRIDESAFRGSELQAIVIPCSVEILGPSCFCWCKSLISVTFESKSRLVRIEEFAFCGSGLRNIVIPPSVETIGNESFLNCSRLESLRFDEGRNCVESVEMHSKTLLLYRYCRQSGAESSDVAVTIMRRRDLCINDWIFLPYHVRSAVDFGHSTILMVRSQDGELWVETLSSS
jgi:hypothetical protein